MDSPAAETSAADPMIRPAAPSQPRSWWRGIAWLLAVTSSMVVPAQFAYAAIVTVLFVLLRTATDHVGWVTIIAYGPRWVWLLPAVALAILALALRRSPGAAIITMGMVLGPVMDANVPYHALAAAPCHDHARTRLRLMTFNVGEGSGMTLDRDALSAAVERYQPDVVVLQELKSKSITHAWPGKWQEVRSRFVGSAAVFSRLPMVPATPTDGFWGGKVIAASVKLTTRDGRSVWLVAPHVMSPRYGFQPVLDSKPRAWTTLGHVIDQRDVQIRRVRMLAGDSLTRVVIAGDFNTVADSPLLSKTMGGLRNAFSDTGYGYGNTKWTRGWGVRIDHVFTGRQIRATSCEVGPDLGSDHLPLIVDLVVDP